MKLKDAGVGGTHARPATISIAFRANTDLADNFGTEMQIPTLNDRQRRSTAMPSKSAQQHQFMKAAAHNTVFAEKAGIPQRVAKEFVAADKRAAKKSKAKRGNKKRKV